MFMMAIKQRTKAKGIQEKTTRKYYMVRRKKQNHIKEFIIPFPSNLGEWERELGNPSKRLL